MLQRRFLSRVLSSRIRAGVRAGLIAAAATGGALVGFGIRHNDWLGSFSALGMQVMSGFGVVEGPSLVSAAVGLLAHTSWMVLWGLAFASVSFRKTPLVTVVWALLVGIGSMLLARSLVPAAMGAVKFAAMPSVQAALCLALMTAGLVTGRALSPVD